MHPDDGTDGSGPPARRDADQVELVRRGYDELSYLYRADDYRADDAAAARYGRWIAELLARLPPTADVLDLGCGCGVPVARDLAAAGHRVTGVDISGVQVRRARELVPQGTFIEADATKVEFGSNSFISVICLYALIHMPVAAQPGLLRRMAGWLAPGGWLLIVTGHDAWAGTSRDWLGGTTAMTWSQADAAASRRWLEEAGLTVTEQRFIPEGDSGHALFWARREA